MMQRCATDFSGKRAQWPSRILIFFQDSQIRVKTQTEQKYLLYTNLGMLKTMSNPIL